MGRYQIKNTGRSLLAVLFVAVACRASFAFNLDDVAVRAESLAKEPTQDPRGQVPEWLLKLSYDQWRDIRFRPERALWRGQGLPFEVQFFHPGLYYDRPVILHSVDGAMIETVGFSPDNFNYGTNDFASRVPQTLGYAGFRVHAPIKRGDYYDEVIVFLGASYFRAVGAEQAFGMSARALAIDTGLSSGEEFPYFREFWLVRPLPWSSEMIAYALLDSPSLTGAYRFIIRPGAETMVEVEGRLFLRRAPQKVAIGALTSMFFHGENSERLFDDFRPEAHDSDGLLLQFASGERFWRPLDNPTSLRMSAFEMTNPKGFGLLQRDRNADHYQDLETHFEHRPSTWVKPQRDWGRGRVELVEIPSKADSNDNIVAFWIPEIQPEVGKPFSFAYTLTWLGSDAARTPGGRVVATRRDRAGGGDKVRFVVDFEGEALTTLSADTVLRGVITFASGEESAELLDQQVVKNPATGGWRLTFRVRPKRSEPIEMRAFLDKGGQSLTETWSNVLIP